MASERKAATNAAVMAATWCSGLKQFCTRLNSSCANLRSSVAQRNHITSPGVDLTAFLEDLNEQVSSATTELESLEAMTTDTHSFEELLAHCMELYKQNEVGIAGLEIQLKQYGYSPGESEGPKLKAEMLEKEFKWQLGGTTSPDPGCLSSTPAVNSPLSGVSASTMSTPSPFVISSNLNIQEASDSIPSLPKSPRFQEFGISARTLTALATQDTPCKEDLSSMPLQQKLFEETSTRDDASDVMRDYNWNQSYNPMLVLHENQKNTQATASTPQVMVESVECEIEQCAPAMTGIPRAMVETSEGSKDTGAFALVGPIGVEEFEKTPSYLKHQVSLQELNAAVAKINELMMAKHNRRLEGPDELDRTMLEQEDVRLLSLGLKEKATILLLLKLNRLVTKKSKGATNYRICAL